MDQIKQQLDQLSELDDQQVSTLEESILSEFESVSAGELTPEVVEALTSLADMADTVREEASRRVAQQEELSARAAEAASRIKGAEPEATGEVETDVDTDVKADAEAPVDAEPEPVAASAAEDETPATDETAAETSEPEAELSTEVVEEEAPVAESELSTEETAEAAIETPTEAEAAVEETPVEATSEETPEVTTEDTAPVEEPAAETELSTEAPAEAVVEEPAEAEASIAEDTTDEQIAQEEAPVTAAADEGNFAPADRRPVDQAVAAPVAITAGADIPGYTAGTALDSMSDIAVLMEKRLNTLRRVNGGDGEQHIVASIETQYPEARTLGGDREENTQKINKVVGPEALAASGGFAAPLEASYDLYPVPATDARPVRDALPVFRAERGGVRYLKAPGLASYQQAVGIWTNQNDIDAADPASTLTKNVLIVGGVQENVAYTDAITLQLQFGNLMTRAFPELIARHNELALIQHARVAEINLLTKINAASLQVTAGGKIGFARDLIVQIKRAAASYRSRNRMTANGNLRAIVPAWILDAAAADLVLQMPGDDTLGTSAATVQGYLAGSNITLTASLDQNVFGAQNAGALLEFPDSFTWFLFPEGSFVFLDGGSLDIGVVRDSGLVGTNDYRMFLETFEGLAFIGDEALAVTSTLNVNGTAAALIDTVGGNASGTDF